MRALTWPLFLLVALSLLSLPGWKAGGRPKREPSSEGLPSRGYRVDKIEQRKTEAISWLRVEVVADTGPEEAWEALSDIEGWARHLRIFTRITPVAKTETMTRYSMSVSPPWPIRDFESVIWLAVLPNQRLMIWRSDKDDLLKSHGRIEVKEIRGGTRVSYEMHSPAKSFYPPWMIRIGLYLILPGIAQDFYTLIDGQDG